jgi:predicted AAA+ superfamily ATPase
MIIHTKLAEGTDPSRILYFSFDDFREIVIRDVITAYASIMNIDIHNGKFLMLFDEIQKVNGWEEQIKRLYDQYPSVKFLVSGSESLFIRKKTRESLAGRFFEFFISPLRFTEFLQFKEMTIHNPKLQIEELQKAFKEYLFCNGFPELINADRIMIEKYLKENIIEKILYRDLPQIVSIRDPAILEQLLTIILQDPGQIIDCNELAGELGIARQTVALYLEYLEKSFLIKKVYNFSRNARKTQRKLKKYYSAIIFPSLIEQNFGKALETAMVLQLQAEFFWRDTYKREVDIIVTSPVIIPIEVKSGNKFDDKNVLYFMKKFNCSQGYLLTDQYFSDNEQENKNIKLVLGFLYLLEH